MPHLDVLEQESVLILRDADQRLDSMALLWSARRASTALVWLARKAFAGTVPMPVVFLDSGDEPADVYALRDRLAREWWLDLHIVTCPPTAGMADRAQRKSTALRRLIGQKRYRGLIFGMHGEEAHLHHHYHVQSPCHHGGACTQRAGDDPFADRLPACAHQRIHPLLPWSDADIWRYTQREHIPTLSVETEPAAPWSSSDNEEHSRIDSFLAELGWIGHDEVCQPAAPPSIDGGEGPWRGACH